MGDMLDCLGVGDFQVALMITPSWNLAVSLWVDILVPLNESKGRYYIEIERVLADTALHSGTVETLDTVQLHLEVAHQFGIVEGLIEIAYCFGIAEDQAETAEVLSFVEIDIELMADMIDIELKALCYLSGIVVDQPVIEFILLHFEMDDTNFPQLQNF